MPESNDAPEAPSAPSARSRGEKCYYLLFDDEKQVLMGVVPPSPEQNHALVPSLMNLSEEIKKEGYGEFFPYPLALENFIKAIRHHETGEYPLAEKKDEKIKISISSDKNLARVQTSKAYGGKTLSREDIVKAIEAENIPKQCLDKQSLKILLTQREDLDLTLAKAIPPQHGKNAYFTPVVESKSINEQDIEGKAAIDHKERFEFTMVKIGDPLLKLTPATEGVAGVNVCGKEIKANKGKTLKFTKPFDGVEIDPEDENTLIAAIDGHPIYSSSGVKVDPVLSVKAVDISTGNIEFDGSLFVKTDIKSGYQVKIKGDILVKGSVDRSELYSEGSISIQGGVLGEEHDQDNNCKLRAAGDIHANFMSHVDINCDGNLSANEYLLHCNTRANGSILLGEEKGKGCIIGGYCFSNTKIQAKTLGSEAYLTTCISLGEEHHLVEKIERLEREKSKREFEENQLTKILEKIRASGKPTNVGNVTLNKARKIENTIEVLSQKIELISDKIADFKQILDVSENLEVVVRDTVYPNVVISIQGHTYACQQSYKSVKFIKQDQDVAPHKIDS